MLKSIFGGTKVRIKVQINFLPFNMASFGFKLNLVTESQEAKVERILGNCENYDAGAIPEQSRGDLSS